MVDIMGAIQRAPTQIVTATKKNAEYLGGFVGALYDPFDLKDPNKTLTERINRLLSMIQERIINYNVWNIPKVPKQILANANYRIPIGLGAAGIVIGSILSRTGIPFLNGLGGPLTRAGGGMIGASILSAFVWIPGAPWLTGGAPTIEALSPYTNMGIDE